MNSKKSNGCSKIIYSCGISFQRWLHITNKNQPGHKLFIWERREASVQSILLATQYLWVCAQTPTNQMQHLL